MRLGSLFALTLAGLPGLAHAADARHPVVIELFQSQGCSSCPPANAALIDYANRPDRLALTFSVDYWDRLGWKDTFASPQFTARQYAYARSIGTEVYTPQVVVNGRVAGVGTQVSEVDALARAADRVAGPEVTIASDHATIAAGQAPAGGADVWVALFDPHVLEVPVARGENAGRTLPHRNVVRRLVKLGHWTGDSASFALPVEAGLERAVLVQSASGPILAAGRG